MKLGSLFDGSGGFPLAGSLCGIEPVWAAEVEPYPIAVTRSRFPRMKHLGDISKVNGADIEPVDIITFGSPCQDLSVAGKRAGLKHTAVGDEETTRSGLFMEAVRIIKEMREATGGEYPRFALWENVLGAFSSQKGEDFRVVLEELVRIVEPGAVMPAVPKAGWAYADSYSGDGWSLAYRVFDAQYWGVPQRRRRIHLVVDFRGQCAREVLFEREGVRGYFETGRTPWQSPTPYAQGGSGADDRAGEGFDGYNGDLTGGVSATLGVNCGVSTGRNGVVECRGGRGLDAVGFHWQAGAEASLCIGTEVCPTLSTTRSPAVSYSIENHPADSRVNVVEPATYTLKIRSGCEGGGKGAVVQEDLSATLATNNDQYLSQPMAFAQNQRDEVRDLGDKAGALQAEPGMKQQTFIAQPVAYSFDSLASNSMKSANPHSGCRQVEVAKTLDTTDPNPCKNQGGIAIVEVSAGFCTEPSAKARSIGYSEELAPTLRAGVIPAVVYDTGGNGAGATIGLSGGKIAPTLISGMKTATGTTQDNLIVCEAVYCLQGNGIDRAETAGCNGKGWKEDVSYTLNTIDRNAVAYATDIGFFNSYAEQSPTLLARGYKDLHLVTYPKDAVNYIVRRLTPTECARLQGFADRWGDIDKRDSFTPEEYDFWLNVRNTHAVINGKKATDYTEAQMLTWYNKLHTDSAEYKMWGNGIALPPALYCMQGIADALTTEKEDDWMN